MIDARCPDCNRYLAKVVGWTNSESLVRVEGICKRHGEVAAVGEFGADDFEGTENW